MLNITEVRIKKIKRGKFLGYASILIDDAVVVDGIEVMEGDNGRYILMPLNPKVKKTRKNSAYPINNEAREQILELVLQKYDEETNE